MHHLLVPSAACYGPHTAEMGGKDTRLPGFRRNYLGVKHKKSKRSYEQAAPIFLGSSLHRRLPPPPSQQAKSSKLRREGSRRGYKNVRCCIEVVHPSTPSPPHGQITSDVGASDRSTQRNPSEVGDQRMERTMSRDLTHESGETASVTHRCVPTVG